MTQLKRANVIPIKEIIQICCICISVQLCKPTYLLHVCIILCVYSKQVYISKPFSMLDKYVGQSNLLWGINLYWWGVHYIDWLITFYQIGVMWSVFPQHHEGYSMQTTWQDARHPLGVVYTRATWACVCKSIQHNACIYRNLKATECSSYIYTEVSHIFK